MQQEYHAAAALDSVEKSGSSPLGDNLRQQADVPALTRSRGHLRQPMLICYIAYHADTGTVHR